MQADRYEIQVTESSADRAAELVAKLPAAYRLAGARPLAR
jgi:hypothetical protein